MRDKSGKTLNRPVYIIIAVDKSLLRQQQIIFKSLDENLRSPLNINCHLLAEYQIN